MCSLQAVISGRVLKPQKGAPFRSKVHKNSLFCRTVPPPLKCHWPSVKSSTNICCLITLWPVLCRLQLHNWNYIIESFLLSHSPFQKRRPCDLEIRVFLTPVVYLAKIRDKYQSISYFSFIVYHSI